MSQKRLMGSVSIADAAPERTKGEKSALDPLMKPKS